MHTCITTASQAEKELIQNYSPKYSQKELILLIMLDAVSRRIIPVGKSYKEADDLIEYGEPNEFIYIGNDVIFRFIIDTDKPLLPKQNRSFVKLCIELAKNGNFNWDPIFVIFLVYFRDEVVPVDYRPRLYTEGFDSLLRYLYDNNLFNHFFDVISREIELYPVNVSCIEEYENYSAASSVFI